MRHVVSRTGEHVRRDDGFAMVFVMGCIALITIIAVGGWALARQTLHNSVKNESFSKAYQVASTGLEEQLSFFSPDRLSEYPKTVSYGNDSYTARIVDLGDGRYVLESEGRSGEESETVLVTFYYLDLWDMNISGGEGSSIGVKNAFNGNSWIYGSLYVNGDVDWGANGALYGGPIFLKDGVWNDSGSGGVGAASEVVDAYGAVKSDPSDGYFTTQRGSAPDITIPEITEELMTGADGYMEQAQNFSITRPPLNDANVHAAADSTYYTVWNGNATIGDVAFGNTGLDGTPRDGIAFDSATGTLYLAEGVIVYCSGTVTFTEDVNYYRGKGIIVARDGFVIDGALLPGQGLTAVIGPAGDQKTVPVMQEDCLALMSMGNVNITTGPSDGSFPGGGISAAIFINGQVIADSSSHCDFRGSLICDSIELGSTNVVLATQKGLGSVLPEGMPRLSGFTARGDWVRR